jgi:hypothetical protein
VTGVYDLPFGCGKKFGSNWNYVVNEALGGWKLSGAQVYYSGFPVTVSSPPNYSNRVFAFTGAARPDQLPRSMKSVVLLKPFSELIYRAPLVLQIQTMGAASLPRSQQITSAMFARPLLPGPVSTTSICPLKRVFLSGANIASNFAVRLVTK